VNNNAAGKLQPLTRSKTTDPNTESRSAEVESPKLDTPTAPCAPERPFVSAIYCSRDCAQVDAGRSEAAYQDIARSLSYEFSNGYPESILTSGLPVHVTDHRNPYAPLSPLFVSSSDTESSHTSNLGNPDATTAASSAPKMMEYFRMSRDGSEYAWQETLRQRRSSMNPAIRPTPMSRQASQQSQYGVGEVSSDSLSSLWNLDADAYFGRSISGSGKIRGMTPAHPEPDNLGRGDRSMSLGSERSAPIPTRTLARSNLSQTSLAASPGSAQAVPIPPEFGSAPNHTLSLLQSYATAFPVRDASGSSSSFSQKGFVFPGGITPSPPNSRRGSFNASINRPGSGTIRARSRAGYEVSWDAFGRDAVAARHTPAVAVPERGRGEIVLDRTPTQSLEVEGGRWKIKYSAPTPGNAIRRTSRSSDTSGSDGDHHHHTPHHANGVAIPDRMQRMPSSTSSNARTPQPGRMSPPGSIPHRPSPAIPDLAALRIGSAECAPSYLSPANGSAPKAGFSWDKHEQSGGKTYELPKGLKIDRSKAGLFYFN